MNFTMLVTVIVTAITFVGIVNVLSRLIAPHSSNAQKLEPYECGIPTRGHSWMQFRVGYYLFAILFLMFEVETVFLFPWAVVTRQLGGAGLLGILFFFIILVLGLAYAWRKGALEWKA
ncbi:MAG: NADH-quinone oxidoreductase subunit A [Bacteroides sp.]|nr:NADH-quinone oxidoreductase subunit A [Bacteroides sp.]